MSDDIRADGRGLRRWLVTGALLALVALAAVACGDDKKSSDTASQTTTTTSARSATTVAPATTTTAAAGVVKTASNAQFGTILTDATSGKTLYIRDTDPAGASSCTGNCASIWPPTVLPQGVTTVAAPTGVGGTWTTAARPDDASKLQVVFNGKALYTYASDTAAGQTNGEGVGGIWHVAKAG